LEKKEYAPGESWEIAAAGCPKMVPAVGSPVKRITGQLHFQHRLPRIPGRFRFGQRDRHHAFRDRWLLGLAKSEIERAKRQNLASNENSRTFCEEMERSRRHEILKRCGKQRNKIE
jgi:hypothetical protein